MDSQEHMQLAGLKSFLNEAMADESRSEGASPPLPGASGLGEFIKKPNGDWATGQLCHPYLFASETGNSVQDLVTEAINPDSAKGFSLEIEGSSIAFKSKKPKTSCSNMIERNTCVHHLVNFAVATGKVKNLITPLDFEHHRDYEIRLAEYSTQFKFKFIVQFDVLFRKGVHAGPGTRGGLTGWLDLAQEIYHKVFVAQSFTRVNDVAPGAAAQRFGDKKDEKVRDVTKTRKKGVTLHDKNKAGEGLCLNWNRGKCGKHSDGSALTKDGKKCTFKHECRYCLEEGHRLTECDAYKKALKSG
jgi:hypothetical protein